MIEILQRHGWYFAERKTCCGPHKEKWKKGDSHTIIIYTGLQKYVVKYQGRLITTEPLNKLDERLAAIDKSYFSKTS